MGEAAELPSGAAVRGEGGGSTTTPGAAPQQPGGAPSAGAEQSSVAPNVPAGMTDAQTGAASGDLTRSAAAAQPQQTQQPRRAARQPGHASGKPKRVTRVIALPRALKERAVKDKIVVTVDVMAKIRSRAYAILSILAAQLAERLAQASTADECAKIEASFYVNNASLKEGVLFDAQTLRYVFKAAADGADAALTDAESRRVAAAQSAARPRRGVAAEAAAAAAPPARSMGPEEAVSAAAEAYFNCTKLSAEPALTCDVLEGNAALLYDNIVTSQTAVKNLLTIGNQQLQRLHLKKVYGLDSKEAKILAERLTNAISERKAAALGFYARRARGEWHRATNRVNKASAELARAEEAAQKADADAKAATAERLRQAEASLATCEKELQAAESALEAWKAPAKRETALATFDAFPFPERRQPRSVNAASEESDADAAPLRTLREIFEEQLAELPATTRQADQLQFRARMLAGLHAAGVQHGRRLTPQCSLLHPFVNFSVGSARRLLGKPAQLRFKDAQGKTQTAPRTGENTLHAVLKDILTESALKRLLKRWPYVGATFRTNGIQLHVSLINQAAQDAQDAKKGAAAKGRGKAKRGEASAAAADDDGDDGEDGADEATAAHALLFEPRQAKQMRPAQNLPETAIITTVDLGIRNVFGATRGHLNNFDCEKLKKPAARGAGGAGGGAGGSTRGSRNGLSLESGTWAYSTREHRNDTGQTRRAFRLRRDLARHRAQHAQFVEAEKALLDHAAATISNVPSLIAAAQARGAAFETLHEFYGSSRRARARLDAYFAERKVLMGLVRKLVPTKDHFVVAGDAQFGSSMRGLPPGAAGRLYKALMREVPGHVFDLDEFRTSILDSVTHKCVRAPMPAATLLT